MITAQSKHSHVESFLLFQRIDTDKREKERGSEREEEEKRTHRIDALYRQNPITKHILYRSSKCIALIFQAVVYAHSLIQCRVAVDMCVRGWNALKSRAEQRENENEKEKEQT